MAADLLGISPVGFAWYSMLGSYRLFRQMAQVSVQMAHDHIATAFHFLISKRLLPFSLPFLSDGPSAFTVWGTSTSIASASAIVVYFGPAGSTLPSGCLQQPGSASSWPCTDSESAHRTWKKDDWVCTVPPPFSERLAAPPRRLDLSQVFLIH